ncbi:MAG: hypothetical protein KA072_06405 [Thermoanaerobaculaceae bacterium]|nr:hypothetical protein [Thermoanaerobaculaceae bacterium]MDI9623062.1 hypothetical protein [Acidobacteriota bacterium]NLH10557.1 hypothetical protein [Holophagae bacterium]HPW55377.1 hypothetical protein [Thermoanaerobaculaceae bacterium]
MRATIRFALVLLLVTASAVTAAPTPTELLRWVPTDAQVVMAVDVAAFRAHPFVQGWIIEHQAAWTGIDSDLHRFLRDAGLDPLRDVDLMIVAGNAQEQEGHALALLAGRYDPASLQAAMNARGAVSETLGGVTLFLGRDEDGRGAVAMPSAELLIAGDEAAVRTALAGSATRRTLVSGAVAAGHIDVRAPFWLVAAVPDQLRQGVATASPQVDGEHADTIRSVLGAGGTIQRVAMQARLDKELTLSGVAVTDTAENAERVCDAVKGALAAARLRLRENHPELVEVLRDAHVQAWQAEVSGYVVIPLPLIETLVAAKPNPASGPGI